MQLPTITNNIEPNFGQIKMPTKKTYRAMNTYYELINDKSTALEYKMLHNEAKARLHYRKFQKADNEFLDLADQYPEDETFIVRLKHILKISKLMNKAIYEKLASVYYYSI